MVLIGMYFGWMGNLLNWQDLLILAMCYIGIGSGITVGFHRLLTHRSFKCHRLPGQRSPRSDPRPPRAP